MVIIVIAHTWITSRSTQLTPRRYKPYYPSATWYEWSSAAVIHNLLVSLPTRLLARCSGLTHQIRLCPGKVNLANYCDAGLVPSPHSKSVWRHCYQFNPFFVDTCRGNMAWRVAWQSCRKRLSSARTVHCARLYLPAASLLSPGGLSLPFLGVVGRGERWGPLAGTFRLISTSSENEDEARRSLHCDISTVVFTPLQIVYPITTSGWGWHHLELCSKELLS